MEQNKNVAATNVCPACGAAFTCGMNAGLPECWCASLPPVLEVPSIAPGDVGACYCPDCLRRRLEEVAARR
ncbi:cysteine-rich CWC family protein [Zoogloea sp.]|uniref:cysteine-rich CWC family protein n=1 Tax=Zoogloea sp. TaxID=49181 RepID=UPI0035AE48E6